MALNFFRQRDIEQMDVHDIPEEFINYFESLDDRGKAALTGSRPDLARALGFVLPEAKEADGDPSLVFNTDDNGETTAGGVLPSDDPVSDTIEEDDETDELEQIKHNFYEGKELGLVLKNNMPNLEALAVPDNAAICMLHRKPLITKQIYYDRSATNPTYGIVLKVCRDCHRVFLEEPRMIPIHNALTARGVPHTFYDLDLTVHC